MSDQKGQKKNEKWDGVAVAALLWLLGVLLMYAIHYVPVTTHGWQVVLTATAFVLFGVSIAGALNEVGVISQSEGLQYVGVGFVFFALAILPDYLATNNAWHPMLERFLRWLALLSIWIGGGMVFFALSRFISEGSVRPRGARSARQNVEYGTAIFMAMLSAATAVAQFVNEVLPNLVKQ